MRRALNPFLLLPLLLATGCGYHQAGAATQIPANVRTLAVPIFASRVQTYHTEVSFTQAIIRELNTRTKYHVLQSDTPSADATLHGTILTEVVTPLTYDSTTGETSSYLITLTAKIVLTAHEAPSSTRTTTSSTTNNISPPSTSAASSRKAPPP